MPEVSALAELLDEWLHLSTFPPPGTPLRCGVSGGADSLALLALGAASGCAVTAVHVDHGQRATGQQEAQLVEERCREIGATFESASVEVVAGSNLEARMRAARYGVLGPDAATGHTADDQAETLLINLLRGSGLVGLGAMQPGPRRPILGLRRSDTESICTTLGWEPFVDPSNTSPQFQRNRIRHELLPLLDDIGGRDVVPLLVRSAAHARDAVSALGARADLLDPTDAKSLAASPPAIAGLAVQRWVRTATGDDHPIDSAAVARVLQVASGSVIAAEVQGGWRVSRSAQRLSLTAPSDQQ